MDTKNNISELYKKLPQKTRETLASPEFHAKCLSIFREYQLSESQSSSIENLVTNQVVGLAMKGELEEKIKSDQSIPSEVSEKLILALQEKVLSSLDDIYRESLSNIQKEEEKMGRDFDIENYINTLDKKNESTGLLYEPGMINKFTEQRIIEIAGKYDLTKTQADVLVSLVGSLVGDSTQITLDEIIKKTGVSSLLAEQILIDLKNRVLDVNSKQFEPKTQQTKSQNTSYIPEIRPENTPVKTNTVTHERPQPQRVEPVITPNYTPRPQVVVNTEPVQSPVAVPRFNAVPLSENEIGQDFIPKIQPKPSAGGIMESKLNAVIDKTTPEAPRPIEKKYSVDPYREPLS